MIFLRVENEVVTFKHFMPFDEEYGLDKTKKELEQEGVLVEEIPEPEEKEGKNAILHCNPGTKELWYEYEDIPKTPEEEQQEKIEAEVKELRQIIDILIGGVDNE